jgi:hypothetical protein
LANGKIPDGLLVLHKCDNPPCCNPRHLFPGTYRDNAQDAVRKGRWVVRSGERSAVAKFTQKEVDEIRANHIKGERGAIPELMEKYDVSRTTIQNLVSGITYRNGK